MSRERITISIKKSVLSIIDKSIDGTNIRNRSHAFEKFVMEASSSMGKSLILMIGGDKIKEKIDAAKHYLNQAKQSGFNQIYIATGENGELVKDAFDSEVFDDLDIEYVEGEGTGGVLRKLKGHLKYSFLVINTVIKSGKNIDEYFLLHKKFGVKSTIFTSSENSLEGVYAMEPTIISEIKPGFSMIEDDLLPNLLSKNQAVVTYL